MIGLRGLTASVLLVAAPLSTANAADMAVKAPPLLPPVYSWTGCYVGGNVGYGWQRNHPFDPILVFDPGSDTGTGIMGGGQIGCDYQFASKWVVGIQGMFDGARVNGSHVYPSPPAVPNEILGFSTRWFGTLTGRIGYAVTPQALLYFKGGSAWVRTNYTDDCTIGNCGGVGQFLGSANTTRSGWTIGGGGEYSFNLNWSLFVEYNYIDFGTKNVALLYNNPIFGAPPTYTYRETQNLQTVLVGLNYRFNSR
jgi:outer membrane immunogenic protein